MPIFKIFRAITRPLILAAERMCNQAPIIREPMVQQGIDRETANMAIYEFKGCPFCMKTRRSIRRLSLNIELRDAMKNDVHREALKTEGGRIQVPCLRITKDGEDTWMYESTDIISFLEGKYGKESELGQQTQHA